MKRLVSVGILSQVTVALAALVRTPLIIESIGVQKFGYYIATIGAWAVLAAVGEGYRSNLRQISRHTGALVQGSSFLNYRKILWLILIALIPSLALLQLANLNNAGSLDWSLFSLIVLMGLAYPYFAGATGAMEGRGNFTWFHWSTISGQTVSVIAVMLVAPLGNTYLFALVTLLPAFVPGFYALIRISTTQSKVDLEGRSFRPNNFYILVLILETVAFSMDSAIVLTLLGPVAAAEFAISQRIMVFFSIIPTILAPLIATKGGSVFNSSWLRMVQIRQTAFAIAISAFILATAGYAFDFLSRGLLEFNIWLIAAGCLNGIVGTFTSTSIQAASADGKMRGRFYASLCLVGVSTLMTFLLLPFIGSAGSFFGTMLGTMTYWILVRRMG